MPVKNSFSSNKLILLWKMCLNKYLYNATSLFFLLTQEVFLIWTNHDFPSFLFENGEWIVTRRKFTTSFCMRGTRHWGSDARPYVADEHNDVITHKHEPVETSIARNTNPLLIPFICPQKSVHVKVFEYLESPWNYSTSSEYKTNVQTADMNGHLHRNQQRGLNEGFLIWILCRVLCVA